MRLVLRPIVACAGAAAALVIVSGLPAAQETNRKAASSKGADRAERVSGVVVKVDEAKPGQQPSGGRRLTINTAVVWRDWVRDQATETGGASTKKAAEKGANSVATKGEPKSTDTMVVVDLGPDTKIEQRYRSSTDEASEGSATPAGAAAKAGDPADTSAGSKTKGDAGRAKSIAIADLKPGLFVDVEYRHQPATNPASKVYVLRPVGGPETPAGGRPSRVRSRQKSVD